MKSIATEYKKLKKLYASYLEKAVEYTYSPRGPSQPSKYLHFVENVISLLEFYLIKANQKNKIRYSGLVVRLKEEVDNKRNEIEKIIGRKLL